MRRYSSSFNATDIAFPVLAVECEAMPFLQNYLDAYEEAVLKLVSLGLGVHGISQTLCATDSLVEEILSQLELNKYVYKESGMPWKLSEDGEKYINGCIEDRVSNESQYGYMFVNPIKKEILPYFYKGDIGQISLFRGEELPYKITYNDESQTFLPVHFNQSALKKAYRTYYRNLQTVEDYEKGYISCEEAMEQVDLFSDLDCFDEADDEKEEFESQNDNSELKPNMFIRPLNKEPEKRYLRMRLIIDPSYPGGYKVESPFDLEGIDDGYFLRQIQWLEQYDGVFLDKDPLTKFLNREIKKISPSYKTSEKDFQVFILERLPLLKLYRTKFPYVYEDMERIYGLMQRQNGHMDKEHIVVDLAKYVVEALFNSFFKNIRPRLTDIQSWAFDEKKAYGEHGAVELKKRICLNVGLPEDTLRTIKIENVLGRLNSTYGNSIIEKFINMLVIEYFYGDRCINRYLNQEDITQKYNILEKLNSIRRKVSHSTEERFTNEDYEFYMANVFYVVNDLLDAFRED